jgi:hypothetical protein
VWQRTGSGCLEVETGNRKKVNRLTGRHTVVKRLFSWRVLRSLLVVGMSLVSLDADASDEGFLPRSTKCDARLSLRR